MLLFSIKWSLFLLQILEISKFNCPIRSLKTLWVFRTLETNILLIPCILHLALIFKIFCNKTSIPAVLFNKSFIPTWVITVSNWPSPSVGSLLCQIYPLQVLVQYRTRDHLKWHQENIWTWPYLLLIDY